jgi:hypothetical protein
MFKRFLHKLGASDLYIQDPLNALNSFSSLGASDFRSNYLLNLKFHEFEEDGGADYIFLLHTNPRFEASTFNVRLRRLVSKRSAQASGHPNSALTQMPPGIATIGSAGSMNMTYKTTQLGNGTKSLLEIACGKSDEIANRTSGFLRSNNPVFVLGATALERVDNTSLRPLAQRILDLHARTKICAPSLPARTAERTPKHGFLGVPAKLNFDDVISGTRSRKSFA